MDLFALSHPHRPIDCGLRVHAALPVDGDLQQQAVIAGLDEDLVDGRTEDALAQPGVGVGVIPDAREVAAERCQHLG